MTYSAKSDMAKKRCLVAGGTGFIGRHLLKEMAEAWELFLLVRTKTERASSNNIRYIYADLSRDWDAKPLPKKIDVVIYLAQSLDYKAFPSKACDMFYVNTVSVVRLLDYARRVGAKKFVFASSGGVHYRDFSKKAAKKRFKPNLDFYLDTKLCTEILASDFSAYMDIIMLRFYFVYGSGQNKKVFIPNLIDRIREGKPLVLYGRFGDSFNPIYVMDAVKAIVRSLKLKGSHRIDIAGPQAHTLREMSGVIGRALNAKPVFKIRRVAKNPGLLGDISLMKRLIGRPQVSFEEGIRLFLQSKGKDI